MKQIAMLVFPNFVMSDLVGVMTAFNFLRDVELHLVWKSTEPVPNDLRIPISATTTFAECPEELEVLFVPGGSQGTIALMDDPEVLDFLAERAEKATYVTSVCTGSLVLGAAGLLRGYRATSHWALQEILPLLEAERVDARYVEDRNRITGAAGLDFGLRLAAKLQGDAAAQRAQLFLEYAPDPPFDAGSPLTAPPAVLAAVQDSYAPRIAAAKEAAGRAKALW